MTVRIIIMYFSYKKITAIIQVHYKHITEPTVVHGDIVCHSNERDRRNSARDVITLSSSVELIGRTRV